MSKAARIYRIDAETQVIVREGDDKRYWHFGVLTDEISGHFTVPADGGDALERLLLKLIKPANQK